MGRNPLAVPTCLVQRASATIEREFRMRTLVIAFGATFALTACTEMASEPIVTSFNESTVGIQIQQSSLAVMTPEAEAKSIAMADAKAQEICSRGPKRRAERASSRQVPAGEYMIATEYLYLCLN
ncbi:hypothetical protein [Primorskyibacter flagellatus]|uniref:hypothetical protein n=1 Tax=Primorskyibacter flagellatus TaxID=1387277 RepID=UPI00117B4836|nr:hypothetical protein [Primorskyibacter flagellatus]